MPCMATLPSMCSAYLLEPIKSFEPIYFQRVGVFRRDKPFCRLFGRGENEIIENPTVFGIQSGAHHQITIR